MKTTMQTSADDDTGDSIARLKGEKEIYDIAYTEKCYEWIKTFVQQGNITQYENNLIR